MIGVIAKKYETEIVKEFFELFKTPWEFYKDNCSYDVILTTGENIEKINAKLLIIYGSEKIRFDCENTIEIKFQKNNSVLECNEGCLPIHGKSITFGATKKSLIRVKGTAETVGIEVNSNDKKIIRIGYDLFQEINFLLSSGQQSEHANIPTLEIHISMLRNWILNTSIPLIEVPPVPAGYVFIACLTHDVDFVGIRNHKFDRTMFGFIYRALFRSLILVSKGQIPWNKLYNNWKSVLLLPGVYFGLVKDFFNQFDRYIEIEKNLGSTYFIIPYKNKNGQDSLDRTAKGRAVKYDITDIKQEVEKLISNGCEVGLHGIDAWHDSEKGFEELGRIADITGNSNIGVRMHWLYYSNRSPQFLEESGFSYDSTFGYNDAVGFRGGTTQVFCPPGTQKFLELPLHIQDTALFYPAHMALNETKAMDMVKKLFNHASKRGGVLTINWHQRSIGPERLWDVFYIKLLRELKKLKVWFATAGEIVEWFKKRRQIKFGDIQKNGKKMRIIFDDSKKVIQPSMIIRMYQPEIVKSRASSPSKYRKNFTDTLWNGEREIEISI